MAIANSRQNTSESQEETLNLLPYNPDKHNFYLLFTRKNPDQSQVIKLNDADSVRSSYFDPRKRTVVLIHGWTNDKDCDFYHTLKNAYLKVEDVNLIAVDWSAGAKKGYYIALSYVAASGVSVAKFIMWLNDLKGSSANQYHIVGFSLGAHQAGIVARNVEGQVPYVTALDPARPGWSNKKEKLNKGDAQYVEVIHSNAGELGIEEPLGDVDFYMNGGKAQPGCVQSHWEKLFKPSCNHARSYQYFAESLGSKGFVGTKCTSSRLALQRNCLESGNLIMGGVKPKPGASGIFTITTNAHPPYAKN